MTTKVNSANIVELAKKYALLVIIVLLGVAFSFMSPVFLTGGNLINIVRQSSVMIIYSIGLTFVMIAGMIDISIVNVALMACMISGMMMKAGCSVWLSVLVGFVFGGLIGLINGFLTTRFELNPMIVTLGTSSLCAGGTLLISGGKSIYNLPESFQMLGRGYLGFIPIQVIVMLAVVAVSMLVLGKTVYGRRAYAIGGNAQVAKLSGIKVSGYQISFFVICSLMAVLAGIISASRIATASSTPSANMLMNVIAAVVIGGTSLNGGKGSVLGSVMGAFMLAMISNGLTIVGLSSYWQTVISAVILLITIIIYRKD